jgi:hypothetical protein
MPSEKAMRCWLVVCVVLMWALFVGLLWDQVVFSQITSREDTLLSLQRHGPRLMGVGLGVMGFGAVFLTRLVYLMLREPRPAGRETNRR